ncbi:MAG: hypothetical protein HKP48_09995 [Winogradskyella sp.]|uniref:glycosyl-4,4'-diaponeurosporenoate acyltransferase CrtO family protein n=1 Tax=Winogradskyella sp. TaxID=1883156 RepID=UPI00185C4B41|nr:hypothetical protein [Winogradskyella sp.]MBT8245117.1 hypothetical protein [Winogradskyella sp.]NNK23598.1 hypothetical protein [Winogradskyella sp.]
MITKHLILGFVFGISMSFISWIVGMIINSILVKTADYKKLSNLNFINSKRLNKAIGITYFKWIVKNTFFKFFNQKLKIENKKVDFKDLRYQMTLSEISHLIGFVFVTVFAIYKSFNVSLTFGISIMIPNVLMNLYPSLLQQENKRRIDKFLNK